MMQFHEPSPCCSAARGSHVVPPPLLVAVVHAVDGVRLVTAATSSDELMCRVAAYVRVRADEVLTAQHAEHVRNLLTAEDAAGAVAHYFSSVGERWDDEWLLTTTVGPEPACD